MAKSRKESNLSLSTKIDIAKALLDNRIMGNVSLTSRSGLLRYVQFVIAMPCEKQVYFWNATEGFAELGGFTYDDSKQALKVRGSGFCPLFHVLLEVTNRLASDRVVIQEVANAYFTKPEVIAYKLRVPANFSVYRLN